jgi:hypothetical protein
MIHLLARIYRRIGIHSAPPGTFFHFIHISATRIIHRNRVRYGTDVRTERRAFGGIAYYDIKLLRRTRPVAGFALIFHMGIGDYLMATPLIRSLRLAHPDLPLYAYGSTHADSVNSPLVIELLKLNPLVDRVFAYRGRPRNVWTDYDWQDALKDIPKDFVVLPVIYDVDPVVFHRATSLLETFNLPIDFPLPAPIAYESPLSAAAAGLLGSIRQRKSDTSATGVVCTHFGARSSGYEYPHIAAIVARLTSLGFLVVSFSPTGVDNNRVIDIDISKITPGDSIELLRALKADPERLFLLSVNSLMWPISASLDIPNLGLHIFHDPSMHQYLYPNIYVVTPYFFPRLPPFRLFLAPPGSYQERRSADGQTLFIDYKPEYIADLLEIVASPAHPAFVQRPN